MKASGQITTFWLKDFASANLKIILEDNFQPESWDIIITRNTNKFIGY